VIEACEEAGATTSRSTSRRSSRTIGTPSLVVCLDSGCGNYDQLWATTSLRGLLAGNLKVEILREGVHSGDASGIVPSSFRILRQLLSRLEDEKTGQILPKDFWVDIPPARCEQAKSCARRLGDDVFSSTRGSTRRSRRSCRREAGAAAQSHLAADLSITGIDGIPPLGSAGQRAAALHDGEDLAAHPAAPRPGEGDRTR
jgi:hypothetical protein